MFTRRMKEKFTEEYSMLTSKYATGIFDSYRIVVWNKIDTEWWEPCIKINCRIKVNL